MLSGTLVESLLGPYNGNSASKIGSDESCKNVSGGSMWEHKPQFHRGGIFKLDPYMLKFHIPLESKTLVSKIDLKQDPLSMELEERDTPSTISTSLIKWIHRFIDLSHSHNFMER